MMNIVSKCGAALLSAACLAEGYYLGVTGVRPSEPSAEFESVKRGAPPLHALPLHQENRGPLLGQSLEEWFQARAVDTGIRTGIEMTDRHVIVTFQIPGLRAESLQVAVTNARVTISCIAKLSEEQKEDHGAYRREAMRQYEMIMPLPAHADAVGHRVVRDPEGFKIIFPRRDDPTLKS